MAQKKLALKKKEPPTEVELLAQKIRKGKALNSEELTRFREMAVSTPETWQYATRAMKSLRRALVEKISEGLSQAFLLAEMDIIRARFDYDGASHLEQLLIDHILTTWLRMVIAEHEYNSRVVKQAVTPNIGRYWDDLVSTAHRRYLRAIETLARVQRLARNCPALQINIANAGGRQVNVQKAEDGSTGTISATSIDKQIPDA